MCHLTPHHIMLPSFTCADLALAEAERCREQLSALRADHDHATKTAATEYSAAEHR